MTIDENSEHAIETGEMPVVADSPSEQVHIETPSHEEHSQPAAIEHTVDAAPEPSADELEESVSAKPKKAAQKKSATPPPEAEETAQPVAAEVVSPEADNQLDSKKKWYVVKVQSAREDSIKAAVERKVKIEGLEEFYGQIAIPVEEYMEKKKVKVTDKKTGEKVTQERNVVKHRKKFPGYLFAEVEFNDRILYLFRETSGVGDFVGASLHQADADDRAGSSVDADRRRRSERSRQEEKDSGQARFREGRQGSRPRRGLLRDGGRGESHHRTEGSDGIAEGHSRGFDLRPAGSGRTGLLAG